MNRQIIYNFINIFTICLALAYFGTADRPEALTAANTKIQEVFVLLAAVVLVHTIKALRLYVALWDYKLKLVEYIKIYCKVTCVSIALPYKLGDFFRIYCFSRPLQSVLTSTIIILLDRFMDTSALLTIILLLGGFAIYKISFLIYLLMIFLVILLIAYFYFPHVCRSWKTYLLKSAPTRSNLRLLKMVGSLATIYRKTEDIIRGRGIIMFLLSLLAWTIEIGCLATLFLLSAKANFSGDFVMKYLTDALQGNYSYELNMFISYSIGLLVLTYIVLKISYFLVTKKGEK